MIRKYKDYIILLIVFLLIVFTPYINKIIYSFNNDLNIENITNNMEVIKRDLMKNKFSLLEQMINMSLNEAIV